MGKIEEIIQQIGYSKTGKYLLNLEINSFENKIDKATAEIKRAVFGVLQKKLCVCPYKDEPCACGFRRYNRALADIIKAGGGVMKKYQIIYADPPWSYDDKLGTNSAKMGGYDKYYKGMSLEDICNLPIGDIASKDCILFLWATMPKLQEAFKVIERWGFKHKTTAFTWVKLNPKAETIFKGVGRWVMGNAELVLLATKGKPKRISKSISQIVLAKRGKHSVKPNEVKNRIIQLMGDLPRIELFARQKTEGWDVWGNEVESDIELNQGT